MSGTDAPPPLRRSPLDGFHRAHGAHMVPFAGWEMPLYVTGILEEHRAVRGAVGLFDVSHMGILTVRGERAADLLARRTTIDAHRIRPGQGKYGFWLDSDGHIFDDLLVTRIDDGVRGPPGFLVVPNAGRADRIEALLRMHRVGSTEVLRHNGRMAILALQGPGAKELLERRYGWPVGELKFYTARWYDRPAVAGAAGRLGLEFPDPSGTGILVSRTGYTGETGYELLVGADRATEVAEELLRAGAVLCGLGARDTLRLEKGYLLSGSEFHLDRTPLEAGQERFVEFDHPFVGREALIAQRTASGYPRLVGLRVLEPGAIPRHGTPILDGETVVGTATSGGLSPTLGYGIALAYVPEPLRTPGTELAVLLRDRRVPARVVALPFLPAHPS